VVVAFAFDGCAAVWIPPRHEFVAWRLRTSHAELSNGCPKTIHRVVHSLCALIVGRTIEMSALIRAKLAPLRTVLVIRPVPMPVLVLFIPTAPAA
jgi:hypothetical protein